MDARRALLTGLIDHAALFPPASETMAEAVAGYVRHRSGVHRWIVGRFLCHGERLAQLVDHVPDDAEAWPVGVIATRAAADRWKEGVAADVRSAADAAGRARERLRIDAFEVRLPSDDPDVVGDAVEGLVEIAEDAGLRRPGELYLEVPVTAAWSEQLPEVVAAIGKARRHDGRTGGWEVRAKLRCGGVTQDAFPAAEQIASFLQAAVENHVPFKLTAGLHHPLPITEAGTGLRMHGFLNLYAAVMLFAEAAIGEDEIVVVIGASDAVGLDPAGLRWEDREVGGESIARLRERLVVGHGSCSLDEPVEDLVALGVLSREGDGLA